VSDYSLTACSPLGDLDLSLGDNRIHEDTGLSIVSLTPRPDCEGLNDKLQTEFAVALPEVGYVQRHGDSVAILGLQPNQYFMISSESWPDPVTHVASSIGDFVYLTDQSDSWAVLSISGPLRYAALERLCPVDIAPDVFDKTRTVRTSMEHLSVIIEKPTDEKFRLYTPRSSAQSFSQALITSLEHVCEKT
jgi:sarcosine oxidase subunit gamma